MIFRKLEFACQPCTYGELGVNGLSKSIGESIDIGRKKLAVLLNARGVAAV